MMSIDNVRTRWSAKVSMPLGGPLGVLVTCVAACMVGWAAPALAQPQYYNDPSSGITFAKIGNQGGAGNAAWPGTTPPTPGDRAVGRGSVGYEYGIGKYEVTTSQWLGFFNAALDRPSSDRLPHIVAPDNGDWGAVPTTATNPGGQRFRLDGRPNAGMLPTGDISWRMAAMYCNWLHNDKRTDRAAFLSGAYDVSTFGTAAGVGFTDQQTRSPGAKYFIPTWDEWLKAAHYDPEKNGSGGGGGGWWTYSTKSDTTLPVYGPPGLNVRATELPGLPGPDPTGPLAQVNARWRASQFPGLDPFNVPLGAYAGVSTAYGLFDVAGGTGEWNEETRGANNAAVREARQWDGSYWLSGSAPGLDQPGGVGADDPSLALFNNGFRIGTYIPSPGAAVLVVGIYWHGRRRNRFGGFQWTGNGVFSGRSLAP